MPGWPDYQKTTAWTFPPTVGAATYNANTDTSANDVTDQIASYTDGKVHVLYACQIIGSAINVDSVNDHTIAVRVRFNRGVDNGGVATPILLGLYRLAAVPSGQTSTAVHFTIVLTQPILFQAGSVGTPNLLQLVLAMGTVNVKWSVGWNAIDWAVT